MADENNNGSQASQQFDELTNSQTSSNTPNNQFDINKQMLEELKNISSSIKNISQTTLREKRTRGVADYDSLRSKKQDPKSKKSDSLIDLFEDEIKKQFGFDDIAKQFKKQLGESLKEITGGVDVFSKDFKKDLAKKGAEYIKNNTQMGQKLNDFAKDLPNSFADNLKNIQKNNVSFKDIAMDRNNIKSTVGNVKNVAAEGAQIAKGGASLAKSALPQVMNVVKAGFKTMLPALGPLAAVLIGVEVVTDFLGKLFGIFSNFFKGLSAAANRDEETRKKMLEAGQQRFSDDIKSIVQQPFKILEESAQKVYDSWDEVLRLVNQTQGYSKAELQSLYGSYSQRLRDEGLSDAIASSDIVNSLKTVIESGMTGKVAEEFAYVATKLNAAIPTQDFFSYSDTYASYVANAIKDGKSQSEAIVYANEQLNSFASNLVYAGRELSGGFTSGLKEGSDLFAKANQIALAAKTNNSSHIGGTLAAISAITGSIAPDLASSIIDSVYSAAVGGNDSNIVALRTLAGVNASNTEFLKQFANNPQQIFSTLFRNLSSYQNMSPDNYMEVAEGISSVFGLDQSALQRLDFAYLADAVKNMNTNNQSLEENLSQLASGQSTLTKEQLRNRQINEYMVEEGLAYVLDNEVARSIQEHMWQEQQTLALQEATYAVELQGTALQCLSDLVSLVRTVSEFLNPIAWIQKAANIIQTTREVAQNNLLISQVLEAGKVGNGNAKVLAQLLTRADLLAANPLKYSGLGFTTDIISRITGIGQNNDMLGLTDKYIDQLKESNKLNRQAAKYNWGQVSKSQVAALGTTAAGSVYSNYYTSGSTGDAGSEEVKAVNYDKLERLYSTITTGANAMENFFSSSQKSKLDEAVEKETQRHIKLQRNIIASSSAQAKYADDLIVKYGMNLAQATQRAEQELTAEADRVAKNLAESNVDKSKFASGYQVWYENASKIVSRQGENLDEMLDNLNVSQQDLQQYFQQSEAQNASNSTFDRNTKEEQFWENSQSYLHDLTILTQDTLIGKHLTDTIEVWMKNYQESFNKFSADFNTYHREWVDYYINHTYYNESLGKSLTDAWNKINNETNRAQEDKLNALTEALTNTHIEDLMDPTVQQNVLLAQILAVLQAIMQQNNTQGKLTIPDAISAMAAGMLEPAKS